MDTLSSLGAKKEKPRYLGIIIVLLLMAGMYLIFGLLTGGRFLTISNLQAVITHAVYPALLAWGISFMMPTGYVDLSLGANLTLSSMIGAVVATDLGLGYAGLFLGCITCAVILGLLGVLVATALKIPAWINTLGFAMIYEAATGGLLELRTAAGLGIQPAGLGRAMREIGTWPGVVIFWLLGAIAAYFLFNKTSIGIGSRALGSSFEVSEMMGMNTKRALYRSALVASLFIGLASCVYLSYSGTVQSVSGLNSVGQMFKPMAMLMLAQALSKYINTSIGIIFSSFFIAGFFNFLTHIGVPSGTGQEICLGLVVILFGIISAQKNRAEVA